MEPDELQGLQLPKQAYAFILAGGRGSRLQQMTDIRCLPSTNHTVCCGTSNAAGHFSRVNSTSSLTCYPLSRESMKRCGTAERPTLSIRTSIS